MLDLVKDDHKFHPNATEHGSQHRTCASHRDSMDRAVQRSGLNRQKSTSLVYARQLGGGIATSELDVENVINVEEYFGIYKEFSDKFFKRISCNHTLAACIFLMTRSR